MSLTTESRTIIDELNISKVPAFKNDTRTTKIATMLYRDIMRGYKTAKRLENTNQISVERIRFEGEGCSHRRDMLKKLGAGSKLCPSEIVREAEEEIGYKIVYRTVLDGHDIEVSFYLKDTDLPSYDGIQGGHIEAILTVLHILLSCSLKRCNTVIKVDFVFTDAKKVLPASEMDIIGPLQMNTGFATRCVPGGNIVIYRKQEWFKLLIHEGFHYFGLDSILDHDGINKRITKLFGVNIDLLTSEAYVETWARILNCYIAGFYLTKNKKNHSFAEFSKYSTFFLELERTYSCFQMVKMLGFMGISYNDLISEGEIHEIKRKLYKEDTNVFAYMVSGLHTDEQLPRVYAVV